MKVCASHQMHASQVLFRMDIIACAEAKRVGLLTLGIDFHCMQRGRPAHAFYFRLPYPWTRGDCRRHTDVGTHTLQVLNERSE